MRRTRGAGQSRSRCVYLGYRLLMGVALLIHIQSLGYDGLKLRGCSDQVRRNNSPQRGFFHIERGCAAAQRHDRAACAEYQRHGDTKSVLLKFSGPHAKAVAVEVVERGINAVDDGAALRTLLLLNLREAPTPQGRGERPKIGPAN